MESDNKEKSVVEQYLGQNKTEAQSQLNIDPITSVAAPLKSVVAPMKSVVAPLGKRTAAFILDKIVLYVVTVYVLSPIFRIEQGAKFAPFIINILTEFIYAGYFYSIHSATPGKIVFDLQVVKVSEEKLSFVEAGLRDIFGKMISGLILCIGYLMPFFRQDRRALHDLIFKTKVITKT